MMASDHQGTGDSSLQELEQEIEWFESQHYLRDPLYHTLVAELHALDSSGQVETHVRDYLTAFVLKIKNLLSVLAAELTETRLRLTDAQHQIEEKHEEAVTQAENAEQLKTQLAHWQGEYQALKLEGQEIQERYERRLKEVKQQKREIKQTFRMVQENTELERQLLENLQLEKEQIHEEAQSHKKEKEILLEELDDIRQKCKETEEKLAASASKLTWEEKRINSLEEELAAKETLIQTLMKQINQVNSQQQEEEPIEDEAFDKDIPTLNEAKSSFGAPASVKKSKKVSFVQIYKLSDEIQFYSVHDDFELRSRKSSVKQSYDDLKSIKSYEDMALNRSVHTQQNEEESNSQVPIFPDFYFAHYVLTVQAVKLKLNRQDTYAVDLSSRYPQMLRERVPFHLWDEWIANKLKENRLK